MLYDCRMLLQCLYCSCLLIFAIQHACSTATQAQSAKTPKQKYLEYEYHINPPSKHLINDAQLPAEAALNSVLLEVYHWAKLAQAVDPAIVNISYFPKPLFFRLQHALRRYNTKRLINNNNQMPADLYKTVPRLVQIVIQAAISNAPCPQVDKRHTYAFL